MIALRTTHEARQDPFRPDCRSLRLKIRLFLMAWDVDKKDAVIPRRERPYNTWCNAKKDCRKEAENLRRRHLFPRFWGCDPEQHRGPYTDFRASNQGSVPAGKEFAGARWNGLYYTRAAKEAARRRQERGG